MNDNLKGTDVLEALVRAGLTVLFYMAAMAALRICVGAK